MPTPEQPALEEQLIELEPCPGCGSTSAGDRIGHRDPPDWLILFWSCRACLEVWPRGFPEDHLHHISIREADRYRARMAGIPEDPPW